jgi:hypothetical protein
VRKLDFAAQLRCHTPVVFDLPPLHDLAGLQPVDLHSFHGDPPPAGCFSEHPLVVLPPVAPARHHPITLRHLVLDAYLVFGHALVGTRSIAAYIVERIIADRDGVPHEIGSEQLVESSEVSPRESSYPSDRCANGR